MKYHAKRTWSNLCNRWFASKLEATRADELQLLELGRQITDLKFQERFVLSEKPRMTLAVDFSYIDKDGQYILEDTKGYETREFRVKRLWFKEKFGKDIIITK